MRPEEATNDHTAMPILGHRLGTTRRLAQTDRVSAPWSSRDMSSAARTKAECGATPLAGVNCWASLNPVNVPRHLHTQAFANREARRPLRQLSKSRSNLPRNSRPDLFRQTAPSQAETPRIARSNRPDRVWGSLLAPRPFRSQRNHRCSRRSTYRVNVESTRNAKTRTIRRRRCSRG
jgi:hypothetical protein